MILTSCASICINSPGKGQEDKDIARLLKAASQLERAWEWGGPIPEVRLVARHGKKITPKLLKLLDHGPDAWTSEHLHVDQQVQLVLCAIFNETPSHAKTIYFVKTLEEQNQKVKRFWKNRVKQYLSEGN